MNRLPSCYVLSPLTVAMALLTWSASNVALAADTTANVATSTSATDTATGENAEALKIVVRAKKLDQARNGIAVSTGSSTYRISEKDIAHMPQGDATPLNQVLLQAPGVTQDSYGQLHVRGDHADLQYRLNGVILPESISGFGQTLDPSFIKSMSLITGALPAQYGYRTAGVVDIQTKTGIANGGSVGVSVGSHDTRELNGSVSGSKDNLTYYFSGSLLENSLGIENPTRAKTAIHDKTEQAKGFGYLSYLTDDDSRLSLIVGSTNSKFQIPNNPNQTPSFQLDGVSNYPSAWLNEKQRETTHYGVLSWQSKLGDKFDYQLSAFSRYTSVGFNPDNIGDLIYTGVASKIFRSGWDNGVQADGSYYLNDAHTIRVGAFASAERLNNHSDISTFPADNTGAQSSTQPIAFSDKSRKTAYLAGVYAQDEWKLAKNLTVNYGGRFDQVNAYVDGHQFSPRFGVVYQPTSSTTLHAGYARYFTPPPTELVSAVTLSQSQGTTSAPPNTLNNPVKSESSDYYDIGLSQQITPNLTVGVDGYYKQIRNLLDEGQFGSALLFTPFNYAQGKVHGIELTANYRQGGFNAYGSVARSSAMGKNIVSSQYNFDQDELDYIANHWIHLDHDQQLTASAGMSYDYNSTTYSIDSLFGSGLRRGFANTGHLPSYTVINLGLAHDFRTDGIGPWQGRVSVNNVLDKVYEIRDGSGVGVGAPQFGARRGVLLSLTKKF